GERVVGEPLYTLRRRTRVVGDGFSDTAVGVGGERFEQVRRLRGRSDRRPGAGALLRDQQEVRGLEGFGPGLLQVKVVEPLGDPLPVLVHELNAFVCVGWNDFLLAWLTHRFTACGRR